MNSPSDSKKETLRPLDCLEVDLGLLKGGMESATKDYEEATAAVEAEAHPGSL